MGRIHLLSKETVDLIAAGEVIERPFNIVKELVENAIDAGAKAITIEIKDGGLSLIRVTDNGEGIPSEDIRTAFLSHATSKINAADDLNNIESLGFRGEALPSIAAVSRCEVITKTKEELTGTRYMIEGGNETLLEEIGAPEGTTFLVRDLFYNVPARKKFLKSAQTEGAHIGDLAEHLALSHPEIAVSFLNSGRNVFSTSGNGALKDVIYRIYGRDITDKLIEIKQETELVCVSGYLAKPEVNRGTRSGENFFINGRYVGCDILQKAVENGYEGFLMLHRFPFVVLHFMIDPSEIDVNIHPAKLTAKLQRGEEVYHRISGIIREALSHRELIPDIREASGKPESSDKKAPEPFEFKRISGINANVKDNGPIPPADDVSVSARKENTISKTRRDENGRIVLTLPGDESSSGEDSFFEEAHPASTAEIQDPDVSKDDNGPFARGRNRISLDYIFGLTGETEPESAIIKKEEQIIPKDVSQMNLFEEGFLTKEARSQYEILGQIFKTFWLIVYEDKLYFMDQHAAHEKVKYERILKAYREKTVASQMLNPPAVVDLTQREMNAVKEYLSCFASLGFEIEEFGGNSLAIRAVPTDLYGCDELELFREVLDELVDNPLKGDYDVILSKLASMSCKAAVKGNNTLTLDEVKALLDELLTLDNPYNCPHGRPTLISMSKYEIEKKFKRIV
ncbi:MAG: DNA mismatch repair endonuclease MutL [Lachnospiraceae bacterium]|nr:DNA mismatch repair endonuclease MutL [Lachnospiraceae bacterium]